MNALPVTALRRKLRDGTQYECTTQFSLYEMHFATIPLVPIRVASARLLRASLSRTHMVHDFSSSFYFIQRRFVSYTVRALSRHKVKAITVLN
jgi:hypothetical protein